jgi:hypothetical protein
MARGETKVGYADLQNTGSTAGSRKRGGEIIPRRMIKTITLAGAAAATAANYGIFFTAPAIGRSLEPDETTNGAYEWEVAQVYERHATAGSDGSAVSLQLVKAASGTAVSAGTAILATAFDLKGTADTNQRAAASTEFSATLTDRQLKGGDSLGLKLTGTPTSVANVTVTVELRRI